VKKKLIISYIVLLHILLGIMLIKSDFIELAQQKIAFTPELTKHYYQMLSYHKMIDSNVPAGCVIFIGDSITQGLCVSAVSPMSVNYGIGGDTSFGVLNRLKEYLSLNRARKAVIEIGFNDLKRRSNEAILNNYQRIIKYMPTNLPIVFSSVLPVDEGVKIDMVGYNKRIQGLNAGLKDLCAKSHRLQFVDVNPSLVDKDGNLSHQFHIGDGVHLNSLGYQIWIDALRKALFPNN
jgi:lysophospholipase L1-like esterase